MGVDACERGCLRTSHATKLELQEAVRVLGTKLWSFMRAESPLNHPASFLLLLLLRKGLKAGRSSGWP